jgi:hypothetical protein
MNRHGMSLWRHQEKRRHEATPMPGTGAVKRMRNRLEGSSRGLSRKDSLEHSPRPATCAPRVTSPAPPLDPGSRIAQPSAIQRIRRGAQAFHALGSIFGAKERQDLSGMSREEIASEARAHRMERLSQLLIAHQRSSGVPRELAVWRQALKSAP